LINDINHLTPDKFKSKLDDYGYEQTDLNIENLKKSLKAFLQNIASSLLKIDSLFMFCKNNITENPLIFS